MKPKTYHLIADTEDVVRRLLDLNEDTPPEFSDILFRLQEALRSDPVQCAHCFNKATSRAKKHDNARAVSGEDYRYACSDHCVEGWHWEAWAP